MQATRRFLQPALALATTAALLAACGGGSDSAPTGPGSLRLALTDAPACGYDEVNVTIEKVRVHQSSSAAESDAGWVDIALAQPKKVNLLNLTNGVLEELGSAQLEAGVYTQLRLMLASGADAHTVVPTGGTATALTVPSGTQTGIKLNANIEIKSNERADFVLDFDACKSVVRAGQSGRHLLKPVIAILPRVTDVSLSVEGYVAPALANGQTAVTLQQGGMVMRATLPDANGRFMLSPAPAAGTYDLVITAEGRVTAVMTGVPVTTTALTKINVATAPIALDASPTSAKASGSVKTSATPATIPDATVRAMQTVGTAWVEVASKRVDADSGAFEFVLPTAAPGLVAYDASRTTAYTFAAQTASAGQYTLEAVVSGKPTQTEIMDLSTGDKSKAFVFAP